MNLANNKIGINTSNGDISTVLGSYHYMAASFTADTVGDVRIYATLVATVSTFFVEKCTVANATKGAGTWATLSDQIQTLGVNIAGQGNVLVAGELDTITVVPFTGTIIAWFLYETSTTPIATTTEMDVWKSTYGAYPPVVGGTIWGTKPKLTTAIKNTATGLNIALAQYDVLKYNLVSNDLAKNIKLVLIFQKS